MREIKFRAFHKYRKEMEYFSNLYWFEENGIQEYDDSCEWIIEQFTGLQDCKGNDIYEGDLLESNQSIGFPRFDPIEVVFKNGSFLLEGYGTLYTLQNRDILRKVGNIHEGVKCQN